MHSPYLRDPEAQSLHVARSRFIDAYGEVEAVICARLKAGGIEPGNRSVGQKIEALRAVKPSPQYSKSERQRIHQTLEMLELINEARCDIVHASLKMVEIDGATTACFINSSQVGERTTLARHVSREQFEQLTHDLKAIAAQLSA